MDGTTLIGGNICEYTKTLAENIGCIGLCEVNQMTLNKQYCAVCSDQTTCTKCVNSCFSCGDFNIEYPSCDGCIDVLPIYLSSEGACLKCGYYCNYCTESMCLICGNEFFDPSGVDNSCICDPILNCASNTSCDASGCTSCPSGYSIVNGASCLYGQTYNYTAGCHYN